jgi:AcrR family transcriptional regulator
LTRSARESGGTGDGGPRPRRRDAAASRKALLDAARTLFGERGYDRTTLRDIGERAGVDPALVARYYGNKAGIYIAALADEGQDTVAARRDLAHIGALADYLVARIDDRGGAGPMLRVALGADAEPGVRDAASADVREALVEPLVERLVAAGADEDAVRRRAQIAVAAVVGIAAMRPTGFFPELSATPRAELVAVLEESLGVLLGER